MSVAHAQRLMHAYGLRVERFLADAKSMDDLGPCFGGDLTAAEVRYLEKRMGAECGRRALAAEQNRTKGDS